MTRFLLATAVTIVAWMAAFVAIGTHHNIAATVAIVAAFTAHEWAIATGRRFEQHNPTKETR